MAMDLLSDPDCPVSLLKHTTFIILHFLRMQAPGRQLDNALSMLGSIFDFETVLDRVLSENKSAEATENVEIIYDMMFEHDRNV